MTTLALNGICKSFGSLRALSDVSVEFCSGEIHAVLGENGAGKSTLMNVVAGFLRPDAGQAVLDSTSLPLGDPLATRRSGVEMVHQHFMLVPEFTVGENFALSALGSLNGTLDLEGLTAPHREIAKSLDWEVDLSARASALPVGVQQRVEILKALASDSPVLILDEPTAVLAPEEVEDLFRVLRALRDRGKMVLLIAHKLQEVMAVADRATVLRMGQWVATTRIQDTTADQLAEWMIGSTPSSAAATPAHAKGESVTIRGLSVKGDRGELAVNQVDLDIRQGEIVGIGGVDGNGQVELAEAIVQIRCAEAGQMKLPKTIGYIPQDRQLDGLAINMSIEDNLLITGHQDQALRSGSFLKPTEVRQWAENLVEKYNIKAKNIKEKVGSLSGGNQQKVVISRVLDLHPELLVAVNPTRGLDFNATLFVHETIRDAAQGGAAVLLISTDRDEISLLAHRSFVISGGRVSEGSLQDAVKGSVL